MRRGALVVLLGLAACQATRPPDEAVLTLVPTAMQTAGAVAPAANDPDTACLIAGGSIAATIAVADDAVNVINTFVGAPVTVIVVAFTATPTTPPSVELRVDDQLIATEDVATVSPRVLAYNVRPGRGEHQLRVSVPGLSPGVLCVQSVATTQR